MDSNGARGIEPTCAGFAQLGASLNVPAEPARYVEVAAQNDVGSAYTDTPLNAAVANLMAAILNSHILTKPMNFYSSSKVFHLGLHPFFTPSFATLLPCSKRKTAYIVGNFQL